MDLRSFAPQKSVFSVMVFSICTSTSSFKALPHLSCVGVFIVSAKRTPFGTYGGVLKDHSATDLAEHAAKAALAAGNVAPELVNSVIIGNVMQVSEQFVCFEQLIPQSTSDMAFQPYTHDS